jgi:FkbM family methyltransferase
MHRRLFYLQQQFHLCKLPRQNKYGILRPSFDCLELFPLKDFIKSIFKALPFDLTKNQRYDRLTERVIKKVCLPGSNSADVGCHKGEILDLFLAASPTGHHFGFEPIPTLFDQLLHKYSGVPNCQIMDLALSNQEGTSSFNYVVSNPSYSGLQKRKYDRPNEQDTLITVKTRKLDDVWPVDLPLHIMKIDVEGGERLVLEGALQTLKRWKPTVIFEHGMGASDLYGSTPDQIYAIFEQCDMKIYLLEHFLTGGAALSNSEFSRQFYERLNYYFVAAPQR